MWSCSSLIGNCVLSPLDLLWIEKVVILLWDKVLVKLEDQWHRSRDVVLQDLLLAHAYQMLHDSSQ